MRVVVQNDPRHPDNYGYIVTHVGMNLDRQLEGFRDMEREDMAYFDDLISGAEPEPPIEVLEGRARLKLTPDMVVHQEIVSELFEEDFLDTEDTLLIEELKAYAESLGFDSELIEESLKKRKAEKSRVIPASQPFPVLPQRQRKEARKRLKEEVNRTAKLLLNILGLDFGGHEMAYKLAPGVTGNNFVAAVQLVNHSLNQALGIQSGQRGKLKPRIMNERWALCRKY